MSITDIAGRLWRVKERLREITIDQAILQERFMASVSDLNAAVASLNDAVNALSQRAAGVITPAELDPAVAAVSSAAAALNALVPAV